MMISWLVGPVGAEVANQSNSDLQHASALGAWVCWADWGAGGKVSLCEQHAFSEPVVVVVVVVVVVGIHSHAQYISNSK